MRFDRDTNNFFKNLTFRSFKKQAQYDKVNNGESKPGHDFWQ